MEPQARHLGCLTHPPPRFARVLDMAAAAIRGENKRHPIRDGFATALEDRHGLRRQRQGLRAAALDARDRPEFLIEVELIPSRPEYVRAPRAGPECKLERIRCHLVWFCRERREEARHLRRHQEPLALI